MRVWTMLLLGCLAIGCGDDTTNNMPSPDLSVTPDMSIVYGTKNCLAVAMCAQGCAGAATCLANCASMGTMSAQMKYQAIGACAVGVCIMKGDASTPPCSSAMDTGVGCQQCLSDAAQGPSCTTQFAACLSD